VSGEGGIESFMNVDAYPGTVRGNRTRVNACRGPPARHRDRPPSRPPPPRAPPRRMDSVVVRAGATASHASLFIDALRIPPTGGRPPIAIRQLRQPLEVSSRHRRLRRGSARDATRLSGRSAGGLHGCRRRATGWSTADLSDGHRAGELIAADAGQLEQLRGPGSGPQAEGVGRPGARHPAAGEPGGEVHVRLGDPGRGSQQLGLVPGHPGERRGRRNRGVGDLSVDDLGDECGARRPVGATSSSGASHQTATAVCRIGRQGSGMYCTTKPSGPASGDSSPAASTAATTTWWVGPDGRVTETVVAVAVASTAEPS